MLSDVEMWQEFGKGIVICPFKPNNEVEEPIEKNGVRKFRPNIDGASIYVTASKVGWHFAKNGKDNAGQRLEPVPNQKTGKLQLIIPKDEWVVLCSEETIYLDKRFSGTCHAKVSMALKGLGHVAAPLKPGCATRLLLVFFNHTSENFEITIGSQIAVVTFHKLEEDASSIKDHETDRYNLMEKMGFVMKGLSADDSTYLCPSKLDDATREMLKDIETHKQKIKDNKDLYSYIFVPPEKKKTKLDWRILIIGLITLVSIALFACSFIPSLSEHSGWMRYGSTLILAGMIVAGTTLLINSIVKNISNKKDK